MILAAIFNNPMPNTVKVTRLKNRLRLLAKEFPNDADLGGRIRKELNNLEN
jgi:hypothetical protein